MPRWVRTTLVAFAALAVWLVAHPAAARAPLCDDRAATGFAPSPTLDPQDASVDLGMSPEDCLDGASRDASFHQGRTPEPLPSPTFASALPADGRVDVPACAPQRTSLSSDVAAACAGVKDRLDRPPRG